MNEASTELKNNIIDTLENHKAHDITLIDVSHMTQICDYMIIVTATSSRHLKNLSEKTETGVKQHTGHSPRVEGDQNTDWIIVDALDIVVHIMLQSAREFYQLESLWDFDEEITEH